MASEFLNPIFYSKSNNDYDDKRFVFNESTDLAFCDSHRSHYIPT